MSVEQSKYLFSLIYVGCLLIPIGLGLVGFAIGWRKAYRQAQQRRTWPLTALLLAYPLGLLFVSLLNVTVPQPYGPLALTQALAPLLFLPLLLLIPFAFLHHTTLLRLALVSCALVYLVRFPPLLRTTPQDLPINRQTFTVMNWNVRGQANSQNVRKVLLTNPADVVVLEEAAWAWLRQDAAMLKTYPYQFSHTVQASTGLVLLSRLPVTDSGVATNPPNTRGWPRLLWVQLVLNNQRIFMVAAHPEAPYADPDPCKLPPCYQPTTRDTLLLRVRSLIDPWLARGENVVVAGDMNVTEREPMYATLTQGLQDAYKVAGIGPGQTWGLLPIIGWDVPLLRIDYLFSSPQIKPLRVTTDCRLRGSDHCIVQGEFAIEPQ